MGIYAKRIRLPDHDYRFGAYFVTICCRKKECFFGEVVDGQMMLNEIGRIAYQFWEEIPEHFAKVEIDEFVIMPNHVHGILQLSVPSQPQPVHPRDPGRLQVEDQTAFEPEFVANRFGPLITGSLSSIISQYKGSVTRWARRNGFEHFAWQPRFHDRFIRNTDELDRIRNYIHQNPKNWPQDEFHT
jgi:putative transposase